MYKLHIYIIIIIIFFMCDFYYFLHQAFSFFLKHFCLEFAEKLRYIKINFIIISLYRWLTTQNMLIRHVESICKSTTIFVVIFSAGKNKSRHCTTDEVVAYSEGDRQ